MTLGHDFDAAPIPNGCRKTIIQYVYYFFCRFGIFIAGMGLSTERHNDYDYSYYLGPNYKDGYRDIKKASTIVSNHCSVNDCLILICKVCPGFCPTIGFKKVPIFNTTIEVLDSFYIDRAGD